MRFFFGVNRPTRIPDGGDYIKPNVSYLQGAWSGSVGTNYNFTNQNFGAPDPDRYIFVWTQCGSNPANFASCTIGGAVAKLAAKYESTDRRIALWYARVPNGTSGTVNVVFSGAVLSSVDINMMRVVVPGGSLELIDSRAGNSGVMSLAVEDHCFIVAGEYASSPATATFSAPLTKITPEGNFVFNAGQGQFGLDPASPYALSITNSPGYAAAMCGATFRIVAHPEGPASIIGSDVLAWYKADVGVSTSNGTAITGWSDQSGNGIHLGVANSSPSFTPNGMNGMQSVRFNSVANSRLQTALNALPALGGPNGFSMFIVANCHDTSSNAPGGVDGPRWVSIQGAGRTNDWDSVDSFAIFQQINGRPEVGKTVVFNSILSASAPPIVSIPLVANANSRFGVNYLGTGGDMSSFLNGVLQNTAVAPPISMTKAGTLSLSGQVAASNSAINADIGEIIITRKGLTNEQLVALDAYFKDRYFL